MCWSGTSWLSLSTTCGLNRINWQGLAQWWRPESTHDFCSVCDIETSLQCFQNITKENGILLGFPCLCPSIVAKILQRGLTLYTAPAAHPAHHSDKTPGVDTKPIEEIWHAALESYSEFRWHLYHLPHTGHTHTGPAEHPWRKQRAMRACTPAVLKGTWTVPIHRVAPQLTLAWPLSRAVNERQSFHNHGRSCLKHESTNYLSMVNTCLAIS